MTDVDPWGDSRDGAVTFRQPVTIHRSGYVCVTGDAYIVVTPDEPVTTADIRHNDVRLAIDQWSPDRGRREQVTIRLDQQLIAELLDALAAAEPHTPEPPEEPPF